MPNDERPIVLVNSEEADQVSRILLVWFNEYPELPVDQIDFEYLRDDSPCMSLSLIQGVYKTRRYITGGYEAESQFKLIYRLQPSNNNQRLSADEVLNSIADWAVSREDKPDIGEARRVKRITSNTRSALFGRYEDGTEDYQILMTLTYEVI